MRHLFVPYYIAKELKSIGFNKPCLGLIPLDGSIKDFKLEYILVSNLHYLAIPIYQQAIDFLYTKGIRVIQLLNFNWEVHTEIGGLYGVYGSADDALLAAIDIVKRNNNDG